MSVLLEMKSDQTLRGIPLPMRSGSGSTLSGQNHQFRQLFELSRIEQNISSDPALPGIPLPLRFGSGSALSGLNTQFKQYF
jgi:hypothetical protein